MDDWRTPGRIVHDPHEGPASALVVEAPGVRRLEAGAEASARVCVGERSFEIRFRVSEGAVSGGVEPFLALALFPAMKLGLALCTEAECSARFLENLDVIQDRFLSWDSSLSRVRIVAPAALDPKPLVPRRSGAFFSGGVDSFHTLFRYAGQVSDLVFVHGFDIPVRDEQFYRQNALLYEEVAAEFGKRLVRVSTNLREFTDCYVDWGLFAHGPALAAVALLLEPQLDRMLIPGEYFPASSVPPPRGSHPETDPLWGTEQMTIVHDGFDRTRAQKLAEIQHHPMVRRLLRVCWQRKNQGYNCCECGKCLRNMAILRAYGVLDQFSCFHLPLDTRKLARQRVTLAQWREMLEEILEILGTPSKDPALTEAIRYCLAERYYRGPRAFLRRALQTLQESPAVPRPAAARARSEPAQPGPSWPARRHG